MKKHDGRYTGSRLVDPDFAEALENDHPSHTRQRQRKTQQFCRQVQRALNMALADQSEDDAFTGLFVEGVIPAPDCGHLLIYVAIPLGSSVAQALGALRRDAARLRSEVATAISRKRAPELSFVPTSPPQGGE